MIPTRTKLIFFFVFTIFLLGMFAILLMQNNNRSIDQYNNLLNRFFLLNDIYVKTNQVNSAILAYVLNPDPEHELLQHIHTQAEELRAYQQQLPDQIENDFNHLLVKNYYNMIDSYLEQGDLTLTSLQLKEQSNYYTHLSRGNQISGFIQSSTLNLINSELSNYHSFYLNIQMRNDYWQKVGIYAFISVMLLCLIFSLWISDGITKPIQALSNAARQISRGQFDIVIPIMKTRDEMQFLMETFSGMCTNIRNLIQEMQEKSELDRLLKKMELRSLQNQMHPHFLFNMLNMVTKMAYMEGAGKTSELIQSIAALLRYRLKEMNHEVPLHDEVQIVREYFFIQKMRFGNRIQFIENIDERLLHYVVPSLTLQPLVENAFSHGVESMESGAEIELSIYKYGHRIIVEIRDNGVGMSQDHIHKVMREPDPGPYRDPLLQADSNGIGMRNVLRRLQIYYQEKDVMEIDSQCGAGTTVRLLLPYSIPGKEELHYA